MLCTAEPYALGGTLYARNPPWPQGVSMGLFPLEFPNTMALSLCSWVVSVSLTCWFPCMAFTRKKYYGSECEDCVMQKSNFKCPCQLACVLTCIQLVIPVHAMSIPCSACASTFQVTQYLNYGREEFDDAETWGMTECCLYPCPEYQRKPWLHSGPNVHLRLSLSIWFAFTVHLFGILG